MSLNGMAEPHIADELHGKISSLSPYALDKTLSKENTAAEGKAVGVALGNKVGYKDIADNLNSEDDKKVLSAKQGAVLKKSVDNLSQSVQNLSSSTDKAISNAQKTADNAQSKADAANDLASRAADTAGGALPLSGGNMTGSVDMGGHYVKGLAAAKDSGDAVSKSYLETYVSDVFLGGEW